MAAFLQVELVAPLVVMTLFVLARQAAGRLSDVRRVTFDNTALLWLYTVGQGLEVGEPCPAQRSYCGDLRAADPLLLRECLEASHRFVIGSQDHRKMRFPSASCISLIFMVSSNA
jgi:hypothetical protein